MKKTGIALLLLALGLLSSDSLVTSSLAAEGRCRVEIIAPLSGPAAMYGVALRNGLRLFEIDRPNSSLKVQFEDNRGTTSDSVSAYRQVLQRGLPRALIVLHSGPAHAVAGLAKKDGVPILAVASDERLSTYGELIRRVWPGVSREGELIAKEAKALGYRRVLFLSSEDEYTEGVSNAFKLHFSGDVSQQRIPASLIDIRTLLTRIRGISNSERFDAVGLCLRAGRVGLLAKQLREQGWQEPLFGCVTMDDSSELASSAGALAGAWYYSASVQEQFKERYSAEFGNQNFVGGAALLYDLAIGIESACQKGVSGVGLLSQLTKLLKAPVALTGISTGKEAASSEIEPILSRHRHPVPAS